MKSRESAENYLKTILLLHRRQDIVRSVDVAKMLGFSKPSVSVAIKKLVQEGHVRKDENGNIALTDEGETCALAVLERHTVIESFLVSTIGIDAQIAHEDACRMEHLLSEETFSKIKQRLAGVSLEVLDGML